MKTVSIIITCYNKGQFIEETINSCLNQTYKDIEVVVYNDASTDNSAEIIEKCSQKDSRIVFLNSEKNRGVVYGRNYAISKSTGEYIFPLDGDDYIDETYIEKAINIVNNTPEISVVYALSKALIGDKIVKLTKKVDFDNLMWDNKLMVSALIKKEDFYKAGQYKEYMSKGYEDWDFWLSCLEQNMKFYKIDEYLLTVRRGSEVKNRRNKGMKLKESDNLFYSLLKNHKKLYANSDSMIDEFIDNTKKYRKYKFLFNRFLIISIVEFLLLIIFVYCLTIK